MEQHLKTRPPKTPFSQEKQLELREKAIEKIKNLLLPDEGILKITMMGSSVKGTFGKYEEPGFRGSLYSDFDFIVFVSDDYVIPNWLLREPDGKPFPDDEMNLAYRNKKFIDNKYDAEVFFIRERNMNNPDVIKNGEFAGIPMSVGSDHPYIVVYSV
ncbi:hypothetical protein KKG22_02410 [Patescibacteria group bacterium]|nr:hypothetical protein [Patescibacteria group bacterium]MBU1721795.1 hypothetical protein [Patescibacteria group bacterium]